MIEIKKITAEQTYAIRLEILRKGINKPYQFDGDFDQETFHLGAFVENELVGVSTFVKNNSNLFSEVNQYQLRGMATLHKVRGKGVGVKLLNTSIGELKKMKTTILWCNAREVALGFYSKLNFKIIGEKFMVDQIGNHYLMYLSI